MACCVTISINYIAYINVCERVNVRDCVYHAPAHAY